MFDFRPLLEFKDFKKKSLMISMMAIAVISLGGYVVHASPQVIYEQPNRNTDNAQQLSEIHIKPDGQTILPPPRLSPIPNRLEVKPRKADEIPPSQELIDIIRRVKNQSIPGPAVEKETPPDYEVSKEALKIIKRRKEPIKAEEIAPSPALKAILKAYRNGSLEYAQRDIKEIEDELYYHQPYSEMNMASIYDLIVLRSGNDIFLSLDYKPLSREGESQEESRSRRIKELQVTIAAIKAKEEHKKAALAEGAAKIHQEGSIKVNIKPQKDFAKTVMDFFGIRKKDESVNYEEMSKTFRAYKRWSEHIQAIDKMFRRKRRQKIQLLHQRRYSPAKQIDCSDPANSGSGVCTGRQLKIDPYKNGNIRFLKPGQ